jgi:hypothetical protein
MLSNYKKIGGLEVIRIFIVHPFFHCYLPMQKVENILSSTSSVTVCPVI